MTRSEKWNEAKHFPLLLEHGKENPALAKAVRNAPETYADRPSIWTIIGISKELILRVADSGFEIIFVTFGLDARSAELTLQKSFSSEMLGEEKVKEMLAAAIAQDVPFYPEDDEAAAHLARLHSSLFSEGFLTEVNGKSTRLHYAGGAAFYYDDEKNRWLVEPTSSLFPVDVLALAREASQRQESVSEAMRIIASLRMGIAQLSHLLENTIRDEQKLQNCLTTFPVLFGLQYRRVAPQHRLGADFVMDFALELTSGLVDLVEIEPSSYLLYTKAGDPRKELVHAEQQVLDWLDWLESNARLARDEFPGMIRPVGQVIIGRRRDLSPDDSRRLRQRNATWNGTLVVLTYDDLLDRATNTLDVLTALDGA
jgi:hypothetical protein